MELLFLPEAEEDVRSAWSWYAREAAGVEPSFLAALKRCLERIHEQPRGFPAVEGKVRRALVRPFPYLLFYVEIPGAIVVVGCMHAARDPRAWNRRR